jgi:hypothetical protein
MGIFKRERLTAHVLIMKPAKKTQIKQKTVLTETKQ